MNWPNRVIAIDMETTGLVSNYDAPTSLDAIVFEDGEPTGEAFSVKIKPHLRCKLTLEAFAVQIGGEEKFSGDELGNAIARLFPDDALWPKDAMTKFGLWATEVGATNIPNVAHRADFDWSFYQEKLACYTSVYRNCLSPFWICTKTMARMANMKGAKTYGLKETATLCGLQFDAQALHDSKVDALICGHVYYRLKALLENN